MNKKFFIYLLLVPVLAIVSIDQWLKSFALTYLPEETKLVDPQFIEFAVHKNFGLAFDLPFRLELVIIFSLIIGFMLVRTAWKTRLSRPDIAFACLTITLGALGNLYDRVVYGFTVDYIFIFGRSAINFSDTVIVLGVVALLVLSSKRNRIDKDV